MNAAKTNQVGTRTRAKRTQRFDKTAVANKDPKCDYSFRRKDAESVALAAQEGWIPVNEGTNSGEKWDSPVVNDLYSAGKTASKGELHFGDTMLFKRTKAASAFFKEQEDEKYNAQIAHVNSSADSVRHSLRSVDRESAVSDTSTKFTQRKGINDDVDEDDIFS